MIRQWREFLLGHAGDWELPRSGEWNFLFHNNYHPHCSNINLLWFHDRAQFPSVVAKVFHEESLPKREFENLQHVYGRVPHLVPRPLHFGSEGGLWTLWMEGVPGWRFGTNQRFDPASLRALVQVVTGLHREFRAKQQKPDAERHHRVVLEPLRTLAEFGPSALVRDGCAALAARSSPDWLNTLPEIPQHGDLFYSNILSNHGRWWVLDWESFGTVDLPFYDLFTLLFSLLRTRGQTPEHWAPSLTEQVPGLIESYREALGLTETDVSRLLLLTLANWFHLQWRDGRKEFTKQMYQAISHYFEHPAAWDRVFLRANGAPATR